MAVVFEMDTGKALVRIHSGKLTEEELEERIKKAATEFFRKIYPELVRLGIEDQYTITVEKNEQLQQP